MAVQVYTATVHRLLPGLSQVLDNPTVKVEIVNGRDEWLQRYQQHLLHVLKSDRSSVQYKVSGINRCFNFYVLIYAPCGEAAWGLQEKWAASLIGSCFYIVLSWLHLNYARASCDAEGKLIWLCSVLVKDGSQDVCICLQTHLSALVLHLEKIICTCTAGVQSGVKATPGSGLMRPEKIFDLYGPGGERYYGPVSRQQYFACKLVMDSFYNVQ